MAADRGLSVGELHELVAVLAAALEDIEGELECCETDGVPLPEDLQEALCERAAFKAAFERLPEGELRGKLRTIFKEELERASPEHDVVSGPEVDLEGVKLALGRVRVAGLRDGGLYRELGTFR